MCKFCENFDWGTAKVYTEDFSDNVHAGIAMAGGWSRFPVNDQFKFCPACGAKNPNRNDLHNFLSIELQKAEKEVAKPYDCYDEVELAQHMEWEGRLDALKEVLAIITNE